MSDSSPLTQPPYNATFMGVVAGAASYYGSNLAPIEYYCESGFAFALNIAPDLCPSAPYCWNHELILKNLRRLGLKFSYIPMNNTTMDKDEVLKAGASAAREAVLSVEALEHQLVTTADEEGLEFSLPWGPNAESCLSRVTFEDLRKSDPKVFGFYRIDKGTLADKKDRILQGLECALEMFSKSANFQYEGYRFGPSAYEVWGDALLANEFDPHGHWWNSQVWSECRSVASEYFSKWEFGENDETRSLAKNFSQISTLLSNAAPHELDHKQKASLVQEAAEVESSTPDLLRRLVDKWNATQQ